MPKTEHMPESERIPIDYDSDEDYAPLQDEGGHDPELWDDEQGE